MSRGFPSNTAAAMASALVRPVTFCKIEFAAGTLYLSNGLGSYTWGGETWTGLGDFASVQTIEEADDVRPYGITLQLSGLDSTMWTTALQLDWYLRPVTLYLACVDADDELIDDGTQIWAGVIDGMDVSCGADGGDIISMTCESELANFERASHRKYTNEQLQADYPGDLFFSAMAQIQGAKLRWRGRTVHDLPGENTNPSETPGEGPGI